MNLYACVGMCVRVFVCVRACARMRVCVSKIYHGKTTLSQTNASVAWFHGLFIRPHWIEPLFTVPPVKVLPAIMIVPFYDPRVRPVSLSQISVIHRQPTLPYTVSLVTDFI